MELPALKKELDKRMLLDEEKKMWLRLGFYITCEPKRILTSDRNNYMMVVILFDGAGNEWDIGAQMGTNIRETVLRWWQIEKKFPRAQEIDPTGLGALENRSA